MSSDGNSDEDDVVTDIEGATTAGDTGGETTVTDVSWVLEWIAAPRPPVHPDPMKGRQAFSSHADAVAFMRRQAPDATFVSLTEIRCVSIDRSHTVADHMPEASPATASSDDLAVDRIAGAMKAKMAASRGKRGDGWREKDGDANARISRMLREHVEKGDPVDVANFCMMLHERGEPIL